MTVKTHSGEPDPATPGLWRVIVEHVRDADGEGLVAAIFIICLFGVPAVCFSIAGAVWIILRAAYGDFG